MASIFGTNGTDLNLIGTADADDIFGWASGGDESSDAGDDTLVGLAGNDKMWGGGGNDLFIGGSGADVFTGGAGIDHAVFHQSTAAVTVNLTTGTGAGGDAQGDLYGSIEHITGSDFADQITGDNAANTLFGRVGDDLLWGMDGDDMLVGGAGADILTGGAGNDSASYHSSDVGIRVDLLLKQGRYGDAEGDLFGSIENLNGSQFDDGLFGDDAANVITGNGGNDVIHGNGGNDEIDGGDGDDYLMGNDGDDVLFGRAGVDTLIGGGGADTFVFTALSDSPAGARDQVLIFESAQGDKIDLRALDADTGLAGDQAFTFIGNGAFTGVAGQLRAVTNSQQISVEADVNGDGVADFQLLVTVTAGGTQLSSNDFLL